MQTLRCLAVRAALAIGLSGAAALAQDPATGDKAVAVRTLTLVNPSRWARTEGVSCVVPFARGEVQVLPDLHVEGSATVWQPFGARWPDGSLRQALCLFRASLLPAAETEVRLVPGPGPALPEEPFRWPEANLTFVLRHGDAVERAIPLPVQVLEDNELRKVALLRARIGTSLLVAEAIVTAWRGQPHAWVDLAVTSSNPTRPEMEQPIGELAVETRDMVLRMRHAGRQGMQQSADEHGCRIVLLRDTVLGDGMCLRRSGTLLPRLAGDGGPGDQTLQAAAEGPVLAATAWGPSGAFGPFGFVPAPPPWLVGDQIRLVQAARHRSFVAGDKPGGDPFAAGPWGLAKQAGQTGDQFDFGVVKLPSVAVSGHPTFLHEVEWSVLQESLRPVHFHEADGTPVRAADHPEWIVWSGRTHWHGGVSRDRLGKPHPEPRYETHGWTGKDREHWSTNVLGAYTQLTGAHWARVEMQHEITAYLAGQTIDPRFSTSGAGAPRGAGRTALAACWLWLCTGDAALLARIHERCDLVYLPQWAGRNLAEGMVRPMAVMRPDARMLQGKHPYWTPWQDAMAATGFEATFRLTGNESARVLAEELALNVVRHGWKVDEKECIVATAMQWREGAPIPSDELAAGDPTVVLWSYGTAFSQWALAAVEIARATALERGDAALAARAEEIQRRVRSERQRPAEGLYDRMGEWDLGSDRGVVEVRDRR